MLFILLYKIDRQNKIMCAHCRSTPRTTCWKPPAQISSARSPTTVPGRCANFHHLLGYYFILVCLNIFREYKHLCPLQVNPTYNMLDTPRPNLIRPQWESYNSAWVVRKLTTTIKLLYHYCIILCEDLVTCCICNNVFIIVISLPLLYSFVGCF